MTYEEELQALPTRVGERNRRLLAIALKGRSAGRDAEGMVGEIVAASGTPPLSEAEVRRAVTRAMALPEATPVKQEFVPKYRAGKRRGNPRLSALLKTAVTEPSAPVHCTSGYSFVREMVEAGGGTATSAELKALSPEPIWEEPRALASDPDSRYRCDLSFRSPVQMMRFPGALRPETRRRQALLYLDKSRHLGMTRLPRTSWATAEL